jgi:hypothetical protein
MSTAPRLLLVAILLAALANQLRAEEEWGDLTGTFIYAGDIPEQPVITDPRAPPGVKDESLVIGKMGGVQNIVVYLHRDRGEDAAPVHPSYAESAGADVPLDCLAGRFEPHVVLLRTTQTLVAANKDTSVHNIVLHSVDNTPYNVTLPAGGAHRFELRAKERHSLRVVSSIHRWMSASLIVQDHPYMATTNDRGAFTIRNLPAGTWTFQFWHEKAGYLRHVTHNGEKEEWPRGRLTVTIAPGDNNLGTIHLAPEVFSTR